MCYSIDQGGMRCTTHSHIDKARRDKALEKYANDASEANRQALTKAEQAWRLTQAGIDELREEAERENNDEKRANAERCQRLRESKLRYAAEVRARERKASGKPGTMKEKLALASDPATPPGMQETLAKDKNEKVRLAVATSSHDSGVLDLLWTDSDPKVLGAVARNEHTEAPALEALFAIAGKDPNSQGSIRLSLASNANCPSSLYLPLVQSGSSQTRSAIAKKLDVDARTLEVIAEDSSPGTRRAAALSPNGSRKVYVTLGCLEAETYVRSAVAENPAVPADILEWIQTNDKDWHIREIAAETLASLQASENTASVA